MNILSKILLVLCLILLVSNLVCGMIILSMKAEKLADEAAESKYTADFAEKETETQLKVIESKKDNYEKYKETLSTITDGSHDDMFVPDDVPTDRD